METGTIVLSKAGRDRGRLFCVIGAEENFCLIADGRHRLMEKPKRKKIKHLQKQGESQKAAQLLREGALTNKLLKKELAQFEEPSK